MAVSPISTYAVVQSTLADVSKVQANLQEQLGQISSGNNSSDFAGMSSQVQQYLSLDGVLARTDQYLNDNKVIETRISTTSTVLGQIITSTTDLQNLIAQRRTGITNSSAFQNQLEGLFQQIAGQLNTSVDNQFLFSGSAINTPPIDAETFPTTQVSGVADSTYYLGNSQDLIARPQDNVSVIYNVRGDAQAFQDLMAGFALAKEGDIEKNDETLRKAYDLVQKGLGGLINLQAKTNANTVQYNTINANLKNSKLYFQGIQETIGNTDLISVSTQVSTNQGILQAAFQIYAKISSLRLSDYLK